MRLTPSSVAASGEEVLHGLSPAGTGSENGSRHPASAVWYWPCSPRLRRHALRNILRHVSSAATECRLWRRRAEPTAHRASEAQALYVREQPVRSWLSRPSKRSISLNNSRSGGPGGALASPLGAATAAGCCRGLPGLQRDGRGCGKSGGRTNSRQNRTNVKVFVRGAFCWVASTGACIR